MTVRHFHVLYFSKPLYLSVSRRGVPLLESFVGEWILDKIQGDLDPHQYGAIKGRSTTHALIDMTHHWNKAVDEGQSVRAVFIDFAKAFDHVDHNVLLEKFMEFNVTIVQWMCSFLRHRRQRVKIGSVMSDLSLIHI